MRVAWFPQAADLAGNPYWPRLQAELEALGVEFETSHASTWTARRWLLEHRRTVDVLHFHFIQPQYIGPGERASLRRLGKFASDLLLARLLGYRIVWTVHDLMPTWPKEPAWVERLARYVIAWLAYDVIVHCQEARRLLRQAFGRARRVHVLPLPSYADVHPNAITQAEARARLDIPQDGRVIGFIGGIRPNKGLEDLIAAFSLANATDALLLIAGRPWPPQSYVEEVRQLAQAHPRILLYAQEIADDEMQVYINAADVLAFPFRQVLTSSSVNLAMAFGRPVIAPRLGCLPELVGADAGFIYEAGDVAGLAAAIKQAAQADLSVMGTAATRRAKAATWHDLAVGTLKAYGGPS
jgi:glycosyltransferase involved in cell wall biosynthesis